MTGETFEIVLAWVADDGAEPTGRKVQRDGYNWFAEWRSCPQAHAVCWLLEGTEEDRVKAETYGAKEYPDGRWAVYTFPVSHPTSLDEAKTMVMEANR